MSYILDALRKSEQERQVAAGRGAGMLFPVATETRPGIGRKLILLIAVALVLTLGLNVWSWWRLSAPARPLPASPAPALAAAPHDAPAAAPSISPGVTPTPPPVPVQPVEPPAVAPLQPAERKPVVAATPKPAALPEKPARVAPPTPIQPPVAEPAARREASGENPKGLPNVSVSGFIRDEATGNMAIINDKLVREGEEVLPGLRLEKIDGEQAVLNYKGQRFRR